MNLETIIQRWTKECIDKYKLGQTTDYVVSLCWTPSNEGQRLAWNIVLIQASPLIGQKNIHICLHASPSLSEQEVDKMIYDGMTQLRQVRAEQMKVNGQT